jgi:hypothetical protein
VVLVDYYLEMVKLTGRGMALDDKDIGYQECF